MRDDYFNPDTYQVIDIVTGEVVPIKIFIESASSDHWQKAFAKTLAEYIGIQGGAAGKVLAYIIKSKDSNNIVHGTIREIAEKLEISPVSVNSVFEKLKKKNLIRKIRNGNYYLSPHIMRPGQKVKGAMMLRLWDEVTE